MVFGSGGDQIWRSQSSGQDGTWVLIGSNGVNGYVGPTSANGGGAPKLAAPDKLSCIHVDASNWSNVQVGIPTGDPNVGANWNWQDCKTPNSGGSSFSSSPTPTFTLSNKLIDTDGAGNVYWLSGSLIYTSTDKGRTFTTATQSAVLIGTGNLSMSSMVCVRGKPNQLLMARTVVITSVIFQFWCAVSIFD